MTPAVFPVSPGGGFTYSGKAGAQGHSATLRDLTANWLPRRPKLAEGLRLFTVPHGALDDQLIWNLAYAGAVARLIYYRRPEPLPRADDLSALAAYWKAHFNTTAGKGTPADFIARASSREGECRPSASE